MLMLQPPGRGSTYRYVLPVFTAGKRITSATALIRRMRTHACRCMPTAPAQRGSSGPAARAPTAQCDDDPAMSSTPPTRAGAGLRLLRAAVFTAVCVVLSAAGVDGNAVEQDLLALGLPVESADRDVLVAVVSLADTRETLGALADGRDGESVVPALPSRWGD